MSKIVIFMVLAGGALLLAFLWMNAARHSQYLDIAHLDSQGTSVIAFGDSLTEGVGASSPEYAWPALVSRRIGRNVINAGRSGDTTKDALNRIETDVLAKNPRIVIIFLGANDALRGMSPQETFLNIASIITRVQSMHAMAMLVGIRGGLQSDPYRKGFADLAEKYRTAYLPDPMSAILLRKDLLSPDNLHPNDAGYAVLAEAIGREVARVLGAAQQP